MTGVPDSVRANFRDLLTFNEATRQTPEEKAKRTVALPTRIYGTPGCDQELRKHNLRMGTSLTKVPGRQLPYEEIQFGNGTVACNESADWTMAFRNKTLYHTVDLGRWLLIMPRDLETDANNFFKILQQVARGMGFNIAKPRIEIIQARPRINDYIDPIQKVVKDSPQLIVLVAPDQSADRYAAIKKELCVRNSIPSQVITRRILTHKKGDAGLMSIATKVAIQMSTKIGGLPWMVKLPIKGLMVIGFDVSHGAKSERFSYGGFVASMDMNAAEKLFYSAVVTHQKGAEISGQLSGHVEAAVEMFK